MTCEFISCGWNDCIPWTLNKTERYNQFKLERTLALPRLPPLCILTLSIFVTTGQSATAQLARSYLNAPQGNLAMYSYTGTRSNTGGVKNLPIPETETRLQTQSLVYSRIIDIGGRTGGVGVALPFTDLLSYDTQANFVTARDAGLGDPSFTFEMNLFGAPALRREEFKDWIPKDYCGLHFLFGVPWGEYDANSAVNLGANRFTFRPLLNYSLTPDEGKSWLDFYGSVFFFTDNDEYLGTSVLSQRPLANLELHCSTLLYDRLWGGVGLVGAFGGKVSVDGAVMTPQQQTGRLAFTAGTPMFKGATAIFGYNQTVARSTGAVDADTFILQLIYLY